MRRFFLSLLVLGFSIWLADSAHGAPPVSAIVNAVGGSGISGKVSLHSTKDGTRVQLRLSGLQPDVEYIAVTSSTTACDVGTAPPQPSDVLGRFRGDKRGTASLTATVTTTIDQIHSVAVQLGDGLTLLACAPLP